MKSKNQVEPSHEKILETPFKEALSERYLAYALSTITDRSLPDVRDGLKPVHRRLLYAMHELGLNPQKGYKKAARVVGDVIGKFHPHGEVAIYDALVRMAQDFAARYPLVDGQGNFGNIDGDNPAAMRYTEARLTDVAQALLQEIDEETILFKPTYDGALKEPCLLPARFPNLLANGAMGIAVGMASSIPPHNVGEICAALMHLMDHETSTTEDLLIHLKGPDFPTGGVLIEPAESILKAYETGRGSFHLRAQWIKEDLKGGGYQIVVTEIPYHVQKARLIEKMAELLENKKLPLLIDLRDESAADVRLVLIPKNKQTDPILFMESLFRQTDLEVRIPLNMNALDKEGIPRVLTLKEVLEAFLEHRRHIIINQTSFRLRTLKNRLELLKGFLIAFLNLDEIIELIREEDHPKPIMMDRYVLSDIQAEAILNMRLRSLRKLEEIEIKKEVKDLELQEQELQKIISDDRIQKKVLKGDILWIQKNFGLSHPFGIRRTQLGVAPILPQSDYLFSQKEPLTILSSQKGWIRAIGGHLSQEELQKVKYKEGDSEGYVLNLMSMDKILIGTTRGRFFCLGVDKLSRGRGFGDPLKLMIDLEQDEEILGLYPYGSEDQDQKYLVVAEDGRGFLTKVSNLMAQTRAGKKILTCPDGVRAFGFYRLTQKEDGVAFLGSNHRLLLLKIENLPDLLKGRGVILQKYRGSHLIDCAPFSIKEGLFWEKDGKKYVFENQKYWMGKNGDLGRLIPIDFQNGGKFCQGNGG